MFPTILIVDDEKLNRNYIRNMVREFQSDATILESPTAEKAQALIEQNKVDILFLDIKMPGISGMELLQTLDAKDFELIFVTAYSSYAIQAIKEDACDYLLKPIKKTEFEAALKKAMQRWETKINQHSAGDETAKKDYLDNDLVITFQQGLKAVRMRDIIYLKADNSYTTIFLDNGQKIVASKPISRFQATLSGTWFFRIHKSYLINAFHFREYFSKDGNFVQMSNGDKLYISRYRLGQFLQFIKTVTGKIKL